MILPAGRKARLPVLTSGQVDDLTCWQNPERLNFPIILAAKWKILPAGRTHNGYTS
jgi:hypothetical protein